MSTWQDIATAPKDGWFLALAAEDKATPRDCRFAVIHRIEGVGFGPWEGSEEAYYWANYFTHWMPLPSPDLSTPEPTPAASQPEVTEADMMCAITVHAIGNPCNSLEVRQKAVADKCKLIAAHREAAVKAAVERATEELRNRWHEATLAKSGKAVLDLWWRATEFQGFERDPSYGLLQGLISTALSAQTAALEKALAGLEHAKCNLGHPDQCVDEALAAVRDALKPNP